VAVGKLEELDKVEGDKIIMAKRKGRKKKRK